MASFELPELPETHLSPQMLVGAASPLWGYFGAAAASGVAYWWMTRWTQVTNLEALFGKAAALPAALLEPAVATAEAATEKASEAAAQALPETPLGGESAPISPLAETLAAPETPAASEVAAESAAVTPPEPTSEAAAEPLPEAAGKARVRRTPPPNGLEA